MSAAIEFCLNKASEQQIADHLLWCDADFLPPLSDRVEIDLYAGKIVGSAIRFEAWTGDVLIGLVAAYCNDSEGRVAYITSVSVLTAWQKRGIALCLLDQCIAHVQQQGFRRIALEVSGDNASAVSLYKKKNFTIHKVTGRTVTMHLNTEKEA